MFLRGELEHQVAAVAEGYTTMVREDVEPLASAYDMNETQTHILTQMKNASALLTEGNLSIEDQIQTISELQRALSRFSDAVEHSPDIAADPSFAHMQMQIGERGEIRSLLSEYNATAAKWNHHIQSELGSVLERIDNSGRSILPYLRFDGEQEFIPVISL